MATGTLAERTRDDDPSPEQLDAWAFYGLPKSFGKSSEVQRGRQVGEVRYIVGWASDQMSRMGWRIKFDDSEDWSVNLPDGTRVVSNPDAEDLDDETHPANASARLLAAVGWYESTVRQVTTNLYVAGELYYVVKAGRGQDGSDEWEVVSVIHPDRTRLLKEASFKVRGLYPHPASPDDPDAPLFGVLPILEDMDWLNRLSRAQSSNRVGMRGILGVADGISVANGTGEDFWEDLDAMIHDPMKDPDDVGMAVLRGPAELIEQSGNGMKGLSLLVPDFPYDDKIDARMDKLVKRLAYGLPIPPEILLGMQAASRATAFQVEEQSYRAHIEPMARRVARIPQEALSLIVPDQGEIRVEPDPTSILARRHSVQDVLEAFDRGAVSKAYLREGLGIPTNAAPKGEAEGEGLTVSAQVPVPTTDPANDAADEAVNAAAAIVGKDEMPATFRRLLSEEIKPEDVTTLDELSEALDHIDATLLAELGGATQMTVERAREKLGAAVRSKASSQKSVPSDLTNAQLAQRIGVDDLITLGVNVDATIEGAVEPLLDWWRSRAAGAQRTVTALLGEGLAPQFDENDLDESVTRLGETVSEHVKATLTSPDVQPLPANVRMQVLSLAGGAE